MLNSQIYNSNLASTGSLSAEANNNSHVVPITNGIQNGTISLIQSKGTNNSMGSNILSNGDKQTYKNGFTKKPKVPQDSEASNIRIAIWSDVGGLYSFADANELSAFEFLSSLVPHANYTQFSNASTNATINQPPSPNRRLSHI
jgi:hypothetical protein